MNKDNLPMTWAQFKAALLPHPSLDLQFEYAESKKVGASYHITEIKQALITAVDCGGKMNAWTEVIVQLFEPANGVQRRPMKVRKALSIIELVEKKLPLDPMGNILIEFGNAEFAVRQMMPGAVVGGDEDLVVKLRPGTVQCKAIERGGNCGEPAEKLKSDQKNVDNACCTPGRGCC